MAKEGALVTDTHPLIFYQAEKRKLSERVIAHYDACEKQEALTYVPIPSPTLC